MTTVGRIVHYALASWDASEINRRRGDASAHYAEHMSRADGSVVHTGNDVQPGDVYPLIITRDWGGDMVNGQLLLDGNDTLWVTSRHEGTEQGQWQWPDRSAVT